MNLIIILANDNHSGNDVDSDNDAVIGVVLVVAVYEKCRKPAVTICLRIEQ